MVRRAIVGYIRRLGSLEDTPQRIALGFAIGIFLAFSPLLGLHTFLGLLLAFAFGLNRAAVLIGVFVNNPWTLVPIYTLAGWVGGLVLGFPASATQSHFSWHDIWQGQFWSSLAKQWNLIKPIILGSTILSVVTAALSYAMALLIITRSRACQSR